MKKKKSLEYLIINYTKNLDKKYAKLAKKENISKEQFISDLSGNENLEIKKTVVKEWKNERIVYSAIVSLLVFFGAISNKNILLLLLSPVAFIGVYLFLTYTLFDEEKKQKKELQSQAPAVISSFLASYSGNKNSKPLTSFKVIYPMINNKRMKLHLKQLIHDLEISPHNYKRHYYDFCNKTGMPSDFYFTLVSFDEVGYSLERDKSLWFYVHEEEKNKIDTDIINRKKPYLNYVLMSVTVFIFYMMIMVMSMSSIITNSVLNDLT